MAEQQRSQAPVPAGPSSGYVIKPPVGTSSAGPGPLGPVAPASGTPAPAAPVSTAQPSSPGAVPTAGTTVIREPVLIGGLTQNGAVIGAALVLGLLVVFVFLRSAVRNNLIARKASLASANGASWAFFTFLTVVSITVVFGLIGSLWAILPFMVPLGVLTGITLLLFIILFKSATRVTR